jgi:hypothetical protein
MPEAQSVRPSYAKEHAMEIRLVQYSPETYTFGAQAAEAERARKAYEVLGEDIEMELALDALEVTDEKSLNAFLRRLVERSSRAVGRRPSRPVGDALVELLAHTARSVLPVAVRRAGPDGALVPTAMQRSDAVKSAARVFAGELEGLSQEDKEYEVTRQFVRFASDAVRHASLAAGASPRDVAAAALARSAMHHAPGLLRTAQTSTASRRGPVDMRERHAAAGLCNGGRWVRRGRTIIVAGC